MSNYGMKMWVVKMYVGDDLGCVARFRDEVLCYNEMLAAVPLSRADAQDWT